MSYNLVVMTSRPNLGSMPSVFDVPPCVGDRIALAHEQKVVSGNIVSIEHVQDFTGTFRANVFVELD